MNNLIIEWLKNEKKRERLYIHFDNPINLEKKIQGDSAHNFFEKFFDKHNVAKRAFWPLIHFEKKERKYDASKEKLEDRFYIKPRPIYYASHLDSCILSYYSYLLGIKYDEILIENGLQNNVLAYRKIDGKNSIDFANKAFEDIINLKNCFCYSFDISSFFESLDWEILKGSIETIIGEKLGDDWKNILQAITEYVYINKEDIDIYGLKETNTSKISTSKFHEVRKNIKKSGIKLLNKNINKKGITQGTPISGMLANIYMLEFDKYAKKICQELGGYYYRYSDDILVIIPHSNRHKEGFETKIKDLLINKINELKLNLQDKKTEIFDFQEGILYASYHFKDQEFTLDKNLRPIQYLGFTFDGKNILIRNKTLLRHNSRMRKTLKKLARLKGTPTRKSRIKGNDGILLGKLKKRFTISGTKSHGKKYGNFYGYAINASKKIGELQTKVGNDNKIKKQLKKYSKTYDKAIDDIIGTNKKR